MSVGKTIIKLLIMIIVATVLTLARNAPNDIISIVGDMVSNIAICIVVGEIFDAINE